MKHKVLTIAKYTAKEILKSRILYVTLFLGVVLAVATYVATEFTYGVPEKIALDFGMGLLSLSSLGIALFMGATLLTKEIDSRTVYMVISRPVPRWAFITGKLFGLFLVLMVNVSILSSMTLLCSVLLGGRIDTVILSAILFNLLECTLLMLFVVFFSLFANYILASCISLSILLIGHAVKEAQALMFVEHRTFIKKVLELYHLVLPGFYKLNLKEFILYNQKVETSYLVNSFLYGSLYSAFLFSMIVYLFNRKNLD
jgi:ABC-2 type transport system permease protein